MPSVMESTSFRPLRLLIPALVVLAGFILFVRPDLLERVGGPTETLDPCRQPLAWHIRSVDPRFGVGSSELREAVEVAAGVWEEAAGRRLFRRDTAGSMAIDLVYDERQRTMEERRAREADLETLDGEVAGLESLLVRLEGRVEARRVHHEREATPASAAAYRSAVNRYNTAVQQYNGAVARYNEALETLRASGGEVITAGDLRSERRTLGGRVMRVDRVLTVAVADRYGALVLVLTHELGHALGLGHVEDPNALMAATYRERDEAFPVRLTAADRAALAELCGPEW